MYTQELEFIRVARLELMLQILQEKIIMLELQHHTSVKKSSGYTRGNHEYRHAGYKTINHVTRKKITNI